MKIISDFHLHTSFSEDSQAPMESMILSAMHQGLKTICFTEHLDMDYPPEYGTFAVDLESYTEELFRLQSLYKKDIEILLGIELGMQPHLPERCLEITERYPFDFVIASQHLLDGTDPYFPEFWEDRREQEGYKAYFSQLLANLKAMKSYDTLGHLDYIVRYGPNKNQNYSYEAYASYIDPILQFLIEQHKCLEVNTAGLKYGLGHPNPEESVLKRYRELGGTLITIGSDAHRPEHIAYDFDKLESILKELGFRSYTIFRQREPVEMPL